MEGPKSTCASTQASNVNIIRGGDRDPATGACRCFAEERVVFTADFAMTSTTQMRYDVGFYIATDNDLNGDGAISGQCSATVSTDPNTANVTQLDPSPPDFCGDIDSAHNPLIVTSNEISTQCPAEGEQVVVPFCTTWRQPGSNETCAETTDAYPGSPSKCNCGDIAIPIFAAPVEFTVTKATVPELATVPEVGGSVTYTVSVKNDSTVAALTLTSLVDAPYGDITQVQGAVTCQIDVRYTVVVTNGAGDDPTPSAATLNSLSDDVYGSITAAHPADQDGDEVVSTDCAVPQTIAVGANSTCHFVGRINSRDTTVIDKVTGSVAIEGVLTNVEGSATFTVKVP